MKNRNRKTVTLSLLGILLNIMIVPVAYGQSDSVSVLVSEENPKRPGFYYKSRYSYLDINMKEDRSLIKFGCFPFIPGDLYNYNIIFLQVAYESKIGKQFSITREINSNHFFSDDVALYSASSTSGKAKVRNSMTGIGLTCRYYPGMKKHIETGNGADNLNGGYLSVNALDLFSFVTYRTMSYDLGYTQKDSNLEFSPRLLLAVGYQKRISRLLYFDTQVYLGKRFNQNEKLSDTENSWGVKMLLGIAFNPKDI